MVPAVPLAEVAADVVPDDAGVLPPHPLAVAVLDLAARPAPVLQHVGRGAGCAVVGGEPVRVRHRDRVLAVLAEDQQVVRATPAQRTWQSSTIVLWVRSLTIVRLRTASGSFQMAWRPM